MIVNVPRRMCGRHFHPALLDVDKHLPVRALFPYGGFLREHQGRAAGDSVTDRTLGRCWSTDVLVHGSHNFRGAKRHMFLCTAPRCRAGSEQEICVHGSHSISAQVVVPMWQ